MPRLTETAALRTKPPASGVKWVRCSEIKTFALRLTPTNRAYTVRPRYQGRKVLITIGQPGIFPFEGPAQAPGARDIAIAVLNAARRGEDPEAVAKSLLAGTDTPAGAAGPTLDDIWLAYQEAGFPVLRGVGRKRESTISADTFRYRARLRPSLGNVPAASINTQAAQRLLDKIPTQGQRNQTLVLLKGLLFYAASRGLAETQTIAIKSGKSREVQNYLTPGELQRLDLALVQLAAELPERPTPFLVLRLLMATGCRFGEIASLRWIDLDLDSGQIKLPRDKTSDTGRDVLLSPVAVAILENLPRTGSPYVFPSRAKRGYLRTVEGAWAAALERAGLRRVRVHDLRHSFASCAIGAGVSLYVVGKLLGHRQANTTSRYAHLERDAARAALDKVARALTPSPPRLKVVGG
jgi:integrase